MYITTVIFYFRANFARTEYVYLDAVITMTVQVKELVLMASVLIHAY